MKKLLLLLACTCLVVGVNNSARAQDAANDVQIPSTIEPAKAAEIKKLLELTGVTKLMTQIKGQLFEAFRAQASSLSQAELDRMEKEMDTNELLSRIIPLYDKYYSLDDLKALNAFYQTPAGQHMLAVQPQIMRESMMIGREWGQSVGAKVAAEIRDEHSSGGSGASSSSSAGGGSFDSDPTAAGKH